MSKVLRFICRISDLVPDGDLKSLIDNLDEKENETGNGKWENVIEKSKTSLSYEAKCCKPKVTTDITVFGYLKRNILSLSSQSILHI